MKRQTQINSTHDNSLYAPLNIIGSQTDMKNGIRTAALPSLKNFDIHTKASSKQQSHQTSTIQLRLNQGRTITVNTQASKVQSPYQYQIRKNRRDPKKPQTLRPVTYKQRSESPDLNIKGASVSKTGHDLLTMTKIEERGTTVKSLVEINQLQSSPLTQMKKAAIQTRQSINDYFNDDFMIKGSLSYIPSNQQGQIRPLLNYSDMLARPTPLNNQADPIKVQNHMKTKLKAIKGKIKQVKQELESFKVSTQQQKYTIPIDSIVDQVKKFQPPAGDIEFLMQSSVQFLNTQMMMLKAKSEMLNLLNHQLGELEDKNFNDTVKSLTQ